MAKPSKARLIKAALEARKRAVALYSHFPVGAALLTANGEIVCGANVESASYGLTCCAERIALFKALTDGKTSFRAIAVVAAWLDPATPCGACRQLLAEYAPEAVVWVADANRPETVREFTVRALLPEAFSLFGENSD
jgi:cytidine deaminase